MTARQNRRPVYAIALLAGSSLVFLAGCSSSSAHAFRSNPTTQMDSRAETRDEIDNNLALTVDTNYRNISNELGRIWFSDRPSRLTDGPKPY